MSEHKTSPDLEAAVAATIKAGLTAYLTVGEQVKPAVLAALEHEWRTEADLDGALRGNLRVAFRLGLFNGDKAPFHKLKDTLLKNASAFLPLDKSRLKSVLVIGPLANVVLTDTIAGRPLTSALLWRSRRGWSRR